MLVNLALRTATAAASTDARAETTTHWGCTTMDLHVGHRDTENLASKGAAQVLLAPFERFEMLQRRHHVMVMAVCCLAGHYHRID